MPRQNRVTPFGAIVAEPWRGTMLGNRGCIHGEAGRILRRSATRRWICCELEFRGKRRPLMQPNRWTELFFLDEASAFAAGHRPCAFCRRADYRRFRAAWAAAHGGPVSGQVNAIDALLHHERTRPMDARSSVKVALLPPGAMVELPGRDGEAWLWWDGALLRWSGHGYGERRLSSGTMARLVTPPSIVASFAAGYVPRVHPSVETA